MFRKLENAELHRLNEEQFKKAEKIPVQIILDNVRSLNNIGSVFRTSDAFRLEKIWLCGITATPPNREIHKTALGAENSVVWEYAENTLDVVDTLKAENYSIYSVEQAENSISLETFTPDPHKRYAFIFGNEIKGVQQEVISASHQCLEIPQFGTKHSLNISVSVGIVLWQAVQPFLKILDFRF